MKTTIIDTIKNPLTIIAVFAGISEVAMTITLIQLTESNQRIFIWFVMFFPIFLVASFFFILYKKPAVLFSPSDYKEDKNYLSSISEFKNIKEIERRLHNVEEVNQTLQTYLEKLVKDILPDTSKAIISEQQERLDYIRKMSKLENNHLYSFFNSELKISPDVIFEIINKSQDLNNLVDNVFEITNDKSYQERLKRIIQRFPRILNDFDMLKKEMEV